MNEDGRNIPDEYPENEKSAENQVQDYPEPLRFKIRKRGNSNEVTLELDMDSDDIEILASAIVNSTGTHQLDFGLYLINRTVQAMRNNSPGAEYLDEQANEVCAAMIDLAPRDAFEGLLISQMLAVYAQSMECMRIATIDDNKSHPDRFSQLTNQSVKLMRTYVAQIEALKKYRTGGQQKMIVEHIHVNEGGQAVIGNVCKEGGCDTKK